MFSDFSVHWYSSSKATSMDAPNRREVERNQSNLVALLATGNTAVAQSRAVPHDSFIVFGLARVHKRGSRMAQRRVWRGTELTEADQACLTSPRQWISSNCANS